MSLSHPWVLLSALAVVPVVLAALRSRAPLPRWQRVTVAVLQVAALLAVVLALAGPSREGPGAVHRVAVVAVLQDPRIGEALAGWREGHHGDPFHVVTAGSIPHLALPGAMTPAVEVFATPDLEAALRTAVALVPDGARGSVALFTDGRHDGAALEAVGNQLQRRGIGLQVRKVDGATAPEFVLHDVSHEPRTAPGEPLRLFATVTAARSAAARLSVSQGAVLAAVDVALAPGTQRIPVDVVVPGSGPVEFTVSLSVDGAVAPEATMERSAVLVDAPLRVLHLAADASRRDALAATVARHGIELVAGDPADPLAGDALQSCSAVFVDDVPAAAWPAAAQQQLAGAVARDGLGLVLGGTHANLGPGGYSGSPLADILPVRMPQREERRDPSVGLVIILDTSGSMGGGRIELAKEVARLALQKLQPHDKVGIVEFHGSKRWAAPLQPATNTIEITRAINRLQAGGGTIIYDALEESYYALLNARTRFQHVLVLTDGGVESGPFEALARRMAGAGQTISTVLIGPQANSPFLLSLSQWGRGRFYACPDRFQLPDLQFREPQTALLPAVQERATVVARAAQSEAVAAFGSDELPPTSGLVEASVRPGAETLLRTAAGEPYLVGWDLGIGRVLVLAGQALGPQGGALRADPAYGAFLADLLRSAGRAATSRMARIELSPQQAGVRVVLTLPAGVALPELPVARLRDEEVAVPLAPVGGGRWEAFVAWPPRGGDDEALVVDVVAGELLASGATMAPMSRGQRTRDASPVLREIARRTPHGDFSVSGSLGGELYLTHDAAPAVRPQVERLDTMFAVLGTCCFLVSLLLRRLPMPWRAMPVRGAAVLLCCSMLGLGTGVVAQELPQGEEAIRNEVTAELARRGGLGELRVAWQGAPVMHRLHLALAEGDLAEVARLAADPSLGPAQRALRVRVLDLLGRPREALDAMGGVDLAGIDGDERADWLLHRAQLHAALGARDAAAADLRAVAALGAKHARRAGLLAGMTDLLDVALELCVPDAASPKDAFHCRLRRALWHQRSGHLAEAADELQQALRMAPLDRDQLHALVQLVAIERQRNALPALVDGAVARLRGTGEPLRRPEIAMLFHVMRELGRAAEALALFAELDADTRAELDELALSLAVEAGDPAVTARLLADRLAQRPSDVEARCALALVLVDTQQEPRAVELLAAGADQVSLRELRRRVQAASELALDAAVAQLVEGLAKRGEPSARVDAALLFAMHHRRMGRDADAAKVLLDAREAATTPADSLRLAENLESLGKQPEAIALYRSIHAQTGAEDLGMRLAWLLSGSKVEEERKEAQELFRRIWTTAGSPARRVQAEDNVLDLAAREGTLADLAIELEERLARPDEENRPAIRDALVKIYGRARDTVGAAGILEAWATAEPARQVEALEQLARVHLAAEEFRNYERVLARLLQVNPGSELDYRQQLAMSALERGRPADAQRQLRDLLDRPGAPDQLALEFAAGIQTLAAQHEEAVRTYRRTLALHPERVETHLLLGNALRAADQRERAIGTFLALLLQPQQDDLFVIAVDGLLNMEAPATVLAAASRIVRSRIANRGDQVFLFRLLQDLQEQQGDTQARLRTLEDTIVVAGEQRSNFVRELMNEAETARDWKSYARHGAALLLMGDEVPPAVFLGIGEALVKQGDVDAASRAFARARMANDFVAVEKRMADIYQSAGRLADAERIWRGMLRRNPQDTNAVMAVARLTEQQGIGDRARELYFRAAERTLASQLATASAARGRIVAANRNATQEPAFSEAFQGVLRTAPDRAAVEPLVQLLERSADGAEGKQEALVGVLQWLRHLAIAYGDEALAASVLAREDAMLAAKPDDANLRAAVLQRRLASGQVEAALALRSSARGWDAVRLPLLAGDTAGLQQALDAAPAAQQAEFVRMLHLVGDDARAVALADRLASLAVDEEDKVEAAETAARLLGRTFDIRPSPSLVVQKALAAEGKPPQRVQAVLNALGAGGLSAAERRTALAAAAAICMEARDAMLAERVLDASGTDIDEADVAALVGLLFQKVEQPYQLSARASHLARLETGQALALLQPALRKLPAEDRRAQVLRILSQEGTALPADLLLAVLKDLDLAQTGIAENFALQSIALDEDFPAPVRTALAARLKASMPRHPATLLLVAREGADAPARAAAARAALLELAARRSEEMVDEALTDALCMMLPGAEAEATLAALPEPADPVVRASLLERMGRRDEAAAVLVAACMAKPDNTSLLYRTAGRLQQSGRMAEALVLFRAIRERSTSFYPYQAAQLARLELDAGNATAALDALEAANDPMLSNLSLYLRVLRGIDDAERRKVILRRLLQQRGSQDRGGMLFVGSVLDRSQPDCLDDALATPRWEEHTLDPEPIPEGASSPELVAQLPGGREMLDRWMRTLPPEGRDADLSFDRALVIAAHREGASRGLVDAAVARVAGGVFDPAAMRIVVAAAQLGMTVPPEALQRAFLWRLSSQRFEAGVALDDLTAARRAGAEDTVQRLLRVLLRGRGVISDYRLRPRIGALLALAAERDATQLLRLAPRGPGSLDADVDAELLAALVRSGSDLKVVREAFRDAVEDWSRRTRRMARDQGLQLAWGGVLLATGDLDAALERFAGGNPMIRVPGLVPSHLYGAAIPPLAAWADATLAAPLADRLVARTATGSEDARGRHLRLGAVLAARLEAAGDAAGAARLRDSLRAACVGLALQPDLWLTRQGG